ncbi:cytochrome b involved in lipid metabolism [Inhella inkyongensis]|uniref:Cytochrome b involved in lipid metabolism n=1 Tax=Inhella inkyongensis TaxID=392593 RepID=A0A840S8X4_9BURK|nr:cytochrome b5-like heme/steroid binding domain-containing protein [Inhella inkyongensis]MBB5206093.1 cytochrome b involved in lipid metabolism [Inhella inkyongensis]
MRSLFYAVTALFWLALLALSGAAPLELQAPPPTADERRISTTELARHARADDCWLAINGQVYALTAYLPEHPADPALLPARCGQDASAAYRDKGIGRAHSARADRLLAQYRIGALAD